MTRYAVFDGHNDLLARLYLAGGVSAAPKFSQGRPRGHLDAAKVKKGGFVGGFFAVWVPSQQKGTARAPLDPTGGMDKPRYDIPLPPEVPQADALQVAQVQIDTLKALDARGDVTICTSVEALETTLAKGKVAALMHMEGAEAIDPDFAVLDDLYAQGLRSLGPVWSRPTRFGHGVPFRFPGSPDIGPGLTADGKRLVAKCNAMGVVVDLAHLNEAGFWDVAALTTKPLVATHSNAHVLCPHARNLTDKQLDAIAESRGVVGLNFATAFLREDGRMDRVTPLSKMLDHLDHMLARMGEDCVALGSDFDGAMVPMAIADAGGLPALTHAMEEHGYGSALINKICSENWMRVLRETLGN